MKNQWKERVLSILVRLVAATWRFSVTGEQPKSKGVVAFWHGEMLPCWKYCSAARPAALVSQSKDGSLLAALLRDWGYEVVRGSSSQGGKEALALMVERAKRQLVLITPDGPRGPRHKAKPGAVLAARRADVPLWLCKTNYKGFIFEKSWDKFSLPLPFAHIKLEFIRLDVGENVECVDYLSAAMENILSQPLS